MEIRLNLNKKFLIIIILFLLLILSTYFVAIPKYKQYQDKKDLKLMNQIIDVIIQIAEKEGHVALSSDDRNAILILYTPEENQNGP